MENSATFFGNILTIISCLAAFEALRLNGDLISRFLKRSQGKARETFDKFSLGALMRKYFKNRCTSSNGEDDSQKTR